MEWESVCVRSGVSQQEMVVECQIRDCRVEAVSGWVLRGCGEDARQTKKRVLKGGTWGEAGLLLLAGNSFTGGEKCRLASGRDFDRGLCEIGRRLE
jgi:hypothetical protein